MSKTLKQLALWEQVCTGTCGGQVTFAGVEDGPWEVLPVSGHSVFKQWLEMLPFFFCFPFLPLPHLLFFLSSPLLIFFLNLGPDVISGDLLLNT